MPYFHGRNQHFLLHSHVRLPYTKTMRAILAGLFTFGGLLVCVSIVFHHFPDGFNPPWLTGLFFAVVLVVLAGVSMFLFNRKGRRPSFSNQTFEQRLAELESQGLLADETFHATRCFQVEEFEDEGLHYFLELADHTVLYLNGQYLYDYAPITDDPEVNQARTFPCSIFTVRRHKTAQYVITIVCSGSVLPPECEAPSFNKFDFKNDLIPDDGQIFRDKSYDQLKTERLARRAK